MGSAILLPGAYYGSYDFLDNFRPDSFSFTITVDKDETTFGSSEDPDSMAVPPNCTYGWSAMGLNGTDHLLEIMVKGANSATDPSYLGIGSFVPTPTTLVYTPGHLASPAIPLYLRACQCPMLALVLVPCRPQPAQSQNPSASGSTDSGHQGLSATDTINIVTSIIGGIAGVIAIIGGVYQCRKWQQGRRKSKLSNPVQGAAVR
ncbi:hypothetical protein B0H17DRAFT_1062374 [Mycena rosella]|uniref:Uncharacterized protein n=1 Tax=Mycena rosella TaxID=1033263 RepID=A0AAD7DHW8_MYCRO|nr:hypothetical protein B0H17DRAFT_1062374 [Mycena rosella]